MGPAARAHEEGVLAEKRGDPEAALAAFRAALELEPENHGMERVVSQNSIGFLHQRFHGFSPPRSTLPIAQSSVL